MQRFYSPPCLGAGEVQRGCGRARVGVDLGSEIFTLSEAERGQVTRCEQVCYIKVESRPGTTKVADMVSVAAVGGKGVARRA